MMNRKKNIAIFIKELILKEYPKVKGLYVTIVDGRINIIYDYDSVPDSIEDFLIDVSGELLFSDVVPIRNIRDIVK